MKQIILGLGSIITAAVLVFIGYKIGRSDGIASQNNSDTVMIFPLNEVNITSLVLHHLDIGDSNTARDLLRFHSDVAIMSLYEISECSNLENRAVARNQLARVAAYRAQFPENYPKRTSTGDAERDDYVENILKNSANNQ